MKIPWLFAAIIFFAYDCSSPAPEKQNSTKPNADTTDLATKRENLCGAKFDDTIKVSVVLSFSNPKTADIFELVVPPGQLSQTQSALTIRNSNNRVIYADTFDTKYFAKYVWNPDTVPTSVKQEDYEKYLLNYVASVTKEQVEKFAQNKIQHFFDNISFDHSQVQAIKKFSDPSSDPFYKEIAADTSRKIIALPCFACDEEGRCYMGWSPKQKKVITLMLADE